MTVYGMSEDKMNVSKICVDAISVDWMSLDKMACCRNDENVGAKS
jgi:hypothetical protein